MKPHSRIPFPCSICNPLKFMALPHQTINLILCKLVKYRPLDLLTLIAFENWAFKKKLWVKHDLHFALQNCEKTQGFCLLFGVPIFSTGWNILGFAIQAFQEGAYFLTILKECTLSISHMWLPLANPRSSVNGCLYDLHPKYIA